MAAGTSFYKERKGDKHKLRKDINIEFDGEEGSVP